MSQVIVAFVADLMFQMRVESTAKKLGYEIQWIETTEQLKDGDPEILNALGLEGVLVDRLSRLGPNLLIFDLGNQAIPWKKWISSLKTVPATRRIPLLCFGSHVDVDALQAARKSGADDVVARSRFVTALPELIQKYAQQTDAEMLAETCDQTLHPKAVKGLERFNQGDYFAAHEWLEEAWQEDYSAGRDLYRGILQVAVAYFQIQKENFRGAVKMFQRAHQWLDILPDTCRGVDIAEFRQTAYEVHEQVLALGPNGLSKFNLTALKPISWRAYTEPKN